MASFLTLLTLRSSFYLPSQSDTLSFQSLFSCLYTSVRPAEKADTFPLDSYLLISYNDLGIHCIVEGIETKRAGRYFKENKGRDDPGILFWKTCAKRKIL